MKIVGHVKLDTKQKVLVAVYTEYQKDIPDMEKAINSKTIGIDNNAFKVALLKLQNEQLITGVIFVEDGNSNIPAAALTQDIRITKYGEKYVEEELI